MGPTVQKFDLSGNNFVQNNLDLSNIPNALTKLNLRINKMTGELTLTGSRKLTELFAQDNMFTSLSVNTGDYASFITGTCRLNDNPFSAQFAAPGIKIQGCIVS